MTEADWMASTDPGAMLAHLMGPSGNANPLHLYPPSDRKLRLFAVACCRTPEVWEKLTDSAPCGRCGGSGKVGMSAHGEDCPDCGGTGRINRSRRAVEVAERYADGLATEAELRAASGRFAADTESDEGPWEDQRFAAWWTVNSADNLTVNVGHYLRRLTRLGLPPAAQADLLRCVFGNPFCPVPKAWAGDYCPDWLTPAARGLAQAIYTDRDWAALPVLGDALEEAGCDDSALLAHLRGPGPHARGCWAVDLLLNKE